MIGNKIKEVREKKNMSITELARRAGIAKSYLSSIERGIQKNPSIQKLEKIAEVLDIDIHLLINKSDEQVPAEGLDPEWIDLAREAMESGISKEQFKEFLEFSKWQKQKNQEK
ncbi:transcriptional regulator [Melghiribacillus thermohalophilus]|uniref:Transcriptional regulator n=1 Tax=Melghiribacillus thermohalophilus TaxID=1324956 RepID=A0A4V2V2V5_9BACI|nr:helix-turn-helix domain-containing protein [Melghiribacillus thermohalophilus]TCT26496.1 transcriptional regulator [Melghiribacillus thermohalophilus]